MPPGTPDAEPKERETVCPNAIAWSPNRLTRMKLRNDFISPDG